jgi:hypothetical protein
MIPKSGNRFSEKDHAQKKSWSGMMIRRKIIPLQTGVLRWEWVTWRTRRDVRSYGGPRR